LGGIEINSNQIANGVIVFDPIEPADSDAAGIEFGVAIGLLVHSLDRLDQALHLGSAGSRPFLWRHLAGREHFQNALENLAIFEQGGVIAIRVQAEIGPFGLFTVTADAVLLKESDAILRKNRRRGLGGLSHSEQRQREPAERGENEKRAKQRTKSHTH